MLFGDRIEKLGEFAHMLSTESHTILKLPSELPYPENMRSSNKRAHEGIVSTPLFATYGEKEAIDREAQSVQIDKRGSSWNRVGKLLQ